MVGEVIDSQQAILEDVWAANEAFARIQDRRAEGLEPHTEDQELFMANVGAIPLAMTTVKELIEDAVAESDILASNGVVYAVLSESTRGDNLESLRDRVVAAIDVAKDSVDESTDVEQSESAILTDSAPVEANPANLSPREAEYAMSCSSLTDVIQIYRDGSSDAATELVHRYSRFIRKEAYKRARHGRYSAIDPDDLFQEGIIGLFDAADKVDLAATNSFLTYAAWSIKGRMQKYIHNHRSAVRIPEHTARKLDQIRFANNRRIQQRNSLLSDEEIREQFDVRGIVDVRCLRRADMLTYYMGSTNTGFAPDRDSSPGNDYVLDQRAGMESVTSEPDINVEDQAILASSNLKLMELVEELDDRENFVLLFRFGFITGSPETLEETGRQIGTLRERARQIEARALAKLKKHEDYHKLSGEK